MEQVLELVQQPWPWWVAGASIAVILFTLLIFGREFGGNLAANYLTPDEYQYAHVSQESVEMFHDMGMEFEGDKPPLIPDTFSWESVFTLKGFLILFIGGLLVGFGARYAGGCTSGHAISGLSALQISSLIAVIGFFAGGLVASYFIIPWILSL